MTELLNLDTQQWQTRTAYPFAAKIRSTPTLYHDSAFLVFGAPVKNGLDSTIARYTPSKDKWEKLGNLQSARTLSAVVPISGAFLVIGGKNATSYKTERCIIAENMMKCQYQAPDLKR